ncbi:MAG TPA: DUF1801 domain-containing protein [Propionicimonas sp.]|nr:DUF1801 domain-containing protein [Propionicimonas sp.]
MTTFADLIGEAGDAGPTLAAVLAVARAEVPGTEEGTSYGVPALHYAGQPLLGLARNAKGFALYPFSGGILAELGTDLSAFRVSKGSLGFDHGQQVPSEVVIAIVRARRAEIDEGHS